MLRIQEITKKTPAELENLVEMPKEFQYVWEDFLHLNATRQSSGFGVNPITYSDIKAYYDLNCIEPEVWEVQLLVAIDQKYLKLQSEAMKQNMKQKPG